MEKAKALYRDIDDYIASFPPETQDGLIQLRQIIKDTAPEAVETISYQMPTFKLYDKYLAYFAGFKKHIGFYPFPTGIEAFKAEATKLGYKTSTGTIQFPLGKPLPVDFIKRIIKYRMQENLENYKRKQKSKS